MTGRGLLAIGVLAFQLAGSAWAADDLASGVKDLLATGLKPSAKALTAARSEYAVLAKRPNFDARAKYAFALVLIEQRQLVEARQVLDEVLAERPEMLPAWQAKIWADLVSRSFAATWTDMRAAADQLVKVDADPSGVDREETRSLARLLGRGVGFLQASEKAGFPAARLKAEREEILAKVGSDRSQFLISEQMIRTEIGKIDKKVAALPQNEDRVAAQKRQRADRKRAASKQVAEAEHETLKTEADGAAQVRSADWEVEQLQTKLAKTQFDAKAIEMALVAQNQEITLQTEAIQRTNPNSAAATSAADPIFDRPRLNLQLLQINASRLLQQRLALEVQIEGLKSQLNSALMMRNGQAAESQQTGAELAAKTATLKQKEKKVDHALKQSSSSPVAGKSTQALAEQRRSFSNFEPFPLEQEKERVLAWFEN